MSLVCTMAPAVSHVPFTPQNPAWKSHTRGSSSVSRPTWINLSPVHTCGKTWLISDAPAGSEPKVLHSCWPESKPDVVLFYYSDKRPPWRGSTRYILHPYDLCLSPIYNPPAPCQVWRAEDQDQLAGAQGPGRETQAEETVPRSSVNTVFSQLTQPW